MPLVDYFSAIDDDAAARVLEGIGGPEKSGYDTFYAKGLDPVVELGTLAAILLDRPYSEIEEDPRHGALVAKEGDEGALVLAVMDELRDTFATADPAQLHDVAQRWAQTDEIGRTSPESTREFLDLFAAFAGRAASRDHHVYCWWCL